MKINYKIIGLVMFVMLICCVSAASATDVDNITVPDDTGIADVDVPVDSVDEVENEAISDDDSSENAVGQENLRSTNINGDTNIGHFFDSNTGVLLSNAGNTLNFNGNFYDSDYNYNTFVVNRAVTINAGNAFFYNMGFDLSGSNITFVGGNFDVDDSVATNSVIDVTGNYTSVTDTVIDVYAPENQDFIAIDIANSNGTLIYGNVITYECNYSNLNNTNYVIRAKNSPNVNISVNEIMAILPFKNVDYSGARLGMDMDLVAAIGIENSKEFYLYFNFLEGYITNTCVGYPTLDMVIICDSDEGYIGWNFIDEIDYVTQPDNPSYLYAIDLYRCNNLTVEFNEINLRSKGGTYISGTNNGTSAAYGIQLTGGYSGVLIKGNTITTANNGPNAGIYSQNFAGPTSLQIINNTITVEGNASLHSWSLVTGMELQDDEVTISGNTITVINKGDYETGHNAYGISFSQYYIRLPTSFVVENNTIELINGHYTVYIQADYYASVTNNCLTSMDACGNATVYDNGNIIIANNYCPQCDGVNCTCTH
jgi:hypothetical protein